MGWTLEEALNTPVKSRKKSYDYKKIYGKSLKQICKENNIAESTVRERITEQGMTLEEALRSPLTSGYKNLWQNKREEFIEKRNKSRFHQKYLAIDSVGKTYLIENLSEFCEKYKLVLSSVYSAICRKKKYKGWLITVKEDLGGDDE